MNKTMVITGAASGLGRALALTAAKQGWQICVADINETDGKTVVDEINNLGSKAIFCYCDIGKVEDFENLRKEAVKAFKRIDVLVNNAGVASSGTLMDTTENEWTRLIELDLMSVIRGSKAFVPVLQKGHNPAIINTASFAAIALAPGMMSYNVTKAGVLAFSASLRAELDSLGIHVGVVCPSFFKTNLVESMQSSSQQTKARINKWMTNSSFTAEDVAQDILNGVKDRRFMILNDKFTKTGYKISRWFPEYFYRKKMKQFSKMFADK
ncbi:MAG: SDR family oxidoreductase [Proteobacteria bacterium]|nr:SDR family oxidoreductase [Pseudomonadota bacterium]